MKFTIPLRRGVKSAAHHPGLVVLLYLAALIPALVAGIVAFARINSATAGSLFARRAFADGNLYGVLADFRFGHPGDLQALEPLIVMLTLGAVLLHVLFAAGVVETLLEREAKREHPFLLGIGRHAWRFVRSGLWFAILLAVLVIGLVAVFNQGINELATHLADGRIQVWGFLAVVAVGVLILAFLDLGYDLSRIAAATHGEGRTFFGLFKGIGHALRHPLLLLPLWLFFSLIVAGLHLGLMAVRDASQPESLGHVLGLIALQQVVFLLAAFFRVGLWGGEVAYFQAIGEPHWCGKKPKPRRQPPQVEYRQPLPVDEAPVVHPADEPPVADAGSPSDADSPVAPASWERTVPLADEDDDDTGPSSM